MARIDYKIKAEIWWCGDSDCDCQQPQITLFIPNRLSKGLFLPFILWEGSYETEGENYNNQVKELKEKCEEWGLSLKDNYTYLTLKETEVPLDLVDQTVEKFLTKHPRFK